MSRKTQRNIERKNRTKDGRRTRDSGNTMRYAVLGGGVLAIGVLVFFGVTALMSGGDDDDFVLPEIPTATPDPSGFGPGPALDGRVVAVTPGHGETVTQESTRTLDPHNPGGVCAEIEFEGTTGTWYRMAVNGEEVTAQTIWDLTRAEDPQSPDVGRLCFDPPEGLPVGRVQAAVSVQDPQEFDAPADEVVGWEFEVVE
jgi:hypothetical protein